MWLRSSGKEREGGVFAGRADCGSDASSAEPEVVAHREIGEHRAFGRYVPDGGVAHDVDHASLCCGEAGDHAQGRGLAASVVPDQSDDLARAHVQVHVADHDPPTQPGAEVFHVQNCVRASRCAEP